MTDTLAINSFSSESITEINNLFASLSPESMTTVNDLFGLLSQQSFQAKQIREVVSVDDWLENPFYCGDDGSRLYDFWKNEIKAFNHSGFTEWVIYGCFAGSTKISLLDGSEKTIEELAILYPTKNDKFWVYSINKDGCITPGKASFCRKTGIKKAVYKVTLDNNKSEYCTPDHLFLLRDNTYERADKLKPGQSLMPFYKQFKSSSKRDYTPEGYERIYDPNHQEFITTHRVVGHYCLNLPLFGGIGNNRVIHHKKGKLNNDPDQLEIMDRYKHIYMHRSDNKSKWLNPEYRAKQRKGVERAMAEGLYKAPTKQCYEARYKYTQKPENKNIIVKPLIEWCKKNKDKSRENSIASGKKVLNRLWKDPKFIENHKKRIALRNKDTNFIRKCIESKWKKAGRSIKNVLGELSKCDSVNQASKKLKISNSCIYRMLKFYGYPDKSQQLKDEGYLNHKVVSVEFSHYEDVYDFEVEDHHNFALSSGVFVHNSLGGGKSTAASVMFIRKLYELSCYEPIPYLFDLFKSTILYFIYFSISLTQAKRTGFGKILRLIDAIPYFQKYFQRDKRKESTITFKNIEIAYGSTVAHQIGLDLFGTILDEGDFFKVSAGASEEISEAREIYTSTTNRRKQRFTTDLGKKDNGLSVLISSPAFSSDFVEKRIASVKSKSKAYLNEETGGAYITEVVGYKIKPGKYKKETFWVFTGLDDIDPRIINSVDDLLEILDFAQLQPKIDITNFGLHRACEVCEDPFLPLYQVSKSFTQEFEEDLPKAIRDVLGKPIKGSYGYLTEDDVVSCIRPWIKSPFSKKIITLSTANDIGLDQFFNEDMMQDKDLPRTIHVDQSINTCKTGIACALPYASSISSDYDPYVMIEWMLAIAPPAIGEIPILRITEFIVYLYELGYNIIKVTYDSFQSRPSIQHLKDYGIDAEIYSVDREDDAYIDLRNLTLTNKIIYHEHPIYKREVPNLIWNRRKRKITRPRNSSKDLCDATAGAAHWTSKLSGYGAPIVQSLPDTETKSEYIKMLEQAQWNEVGL